MGKIAHLVERMKRKLEKGCEARDILCVTFTRRCKGKFILAFRYRADAVQKPIFRKPPVSHVIES